MTNEVIAIDQLKRFIDRIEILEDQKNEIAEDIKEVMDEAKSHGFDTKIMKQIIKLKKVDKDKLAEQDAILELYRGALGI